MICITGPLAFILLVCNGGLPCKSGGVVFLYLLVAAGNTISGQHMKEIE